MAAPTGDVLTAGWSAVPPGAVYSAVDEPYSALDLLDYADSALPAVLTLAFPGGGATFAQASVYLRGFGADLSVLAEFLDGSGNVVGACAEVSVAGGSGQLVVSQAPVSASWTRMRLTIAEQGAMAMTFNDAAVTFNDAAVTFEQA